MDEREKDLREKIKELEALLAVGASSPTGAELHDAAEKTLLALEFRASDAMIGLSVVPAALVAKAEQLVWEARKKAALLGHLDSVVRLLSSAWAKRDDAAAGEAVVLAKPNDTDPRVAYLLGLYAFHGFGMGKDFAQSRAWHVKAAELGHADAMFELYAMTAQGLGCEPDADAAFAYCKAAAEAGSARAMANLGGFYATGRHVEADESAALQWYEAAATRGHGKAAATLGVMYASGEGAPRSIEKAREYFSLAAENGFDWESFAEAVGLDLDSLGEKKRRPKAMARPKKKVASKKVSSSKKVAVNKAPAKKVAAKKAPAKKTAVKGASTKKAPAKKPAVKKAAVKKAAVKKAAPKRKK